MPYPNPSRGTPWHAGAPEGTAGATLTEPKSSVDSGAGHRGRVALITGGATGLGRAIALEFARQGCNIVFCFKDLPGRDVRESALLTETSLTAMGIEVYANCCDVRNRAEVAEFMRQACERFGTVHYLINNAGIAKDGALWRLSPATWNDVIETNLTGAFNCIAELSPVFRQQRFGKVVSVSSHQAVRPGFGVASYAASKAGLEALTRSAAVELGPANVNVNAVAPGFVRTERLEELPPDVIDRARKRSVLGRLADPGDIANVVSFLCSDDARHITGQTLVVDGGLSLG